MGGVCLMGVSAQWVSVQGGVSQHALGQTPPHLDRMTDRCKNITLLQLRFRTVMTWVRS